MSADVETIFGELVAQHGGEALTIAHKAIVRRIAALLASDDLDRGDAATIAALTAMLPAVAATVDIDFVGPWDLNKLTDTELITLRDLAGKATGVVQCADDALLLPTFAEVEGELAAARSDNVVLRAEVSRLTEAGRARDAAAALGRASPASETAEAATAAAGDVSRRGDVPAKPSNVTPLRRTPQDAATEAERLHACYAPDPFDGIVRERRDPFGNYG